MDLYYKSHNTILLLSSMQTNKYDHPYKTTAAAILKYHQVGILYKHFLIV